VRKDIDVNNMIDYPTLDLDMNENKGMALV
jgi:hypothetical protein